MPVEIRRGSSRFIDRSGRGEPGWRTAHGFSFGAHYDPDRTAFGPMICHDDHLLAQGSGFEAHHHSGLTIVSWVLTGALLHTDGLGAHQVVSPGEVAVLHAGSGVEHAEVAAAPMTRFVQVWLTPPKPDQPGPETAPSYAVTPVDLPLGSLVEASTPQPGATLSVARLSYGQSLTLPAAPLLHTYVARGALIRSSMAEPLADGDAFLFTAEPAHEVTAGADTVLLVWAFG